MSGPSVRTADVLAYRLAVQGLENTSDSTGNPNAALDLGVQDTGPDGSAWALALRGASPGSSDVALAWTLRGAPHAYRRTDLAQVRRAVSPVDEADAAKRIFDAAKPLKAAGIPVLDALHRIAGEMADIVSEPTVKGDVSTELARRLPDPYLRYCGVCEATHLYEMPFRLAALYGGLELEPGTSPPVLRRAPELADQPIGPDPDPAGADERLQPLRAFLHLHAPATHAHAAWYLDTPLAAVRRAWPQDAVPVEVGEETRWALEDDLPLLTAPPKPTATALLGPFDGFVQTKDRELLAPDAAARKDLWRTIGRPGAVLHRGSLVGSWRPRTSGRRLDIELRPWGRTSASLLRAVEEAAQRLADFRGRSLGQVTTS